MVEAVTGEIIPLELDVPGKCSSLPSWMDFSISTTLSKLQRLTNVPRILLQLDACSSAAAGTLKDTGILCGAHWHGSNNNEWADSLTSTSIAFPFLFLGQLWLDSPYASFSPHPVAEWYLAILFPCIFFYLPFFFTHARHLPRCWALLRQSNRARLWAIGAKGWRLSDLHPTAVTRNISEPGSDPGSHVGDSPVLKTKEYVDFRG